MRPLRDLIAIAAAMAGLSTALATPILLNFEGIGSQAAINDFYNGGTDSQGHAGTDYGIAFGSNALALSELDPAANFSHEPTPNNVMFFLTGSAVLNYAPGFVTGFSFWYSTVSYAAQVRVYEGLDGTGHLLGMISLPALGDGPDPANDFSNWAIGSLAFNGQARSIDFGGTVNQVAFDNITFGSVDPNPVPAPGTLVLALGALGLGATATRRRAR